jgi:hypothetical protein
MTTSPREVQLAYEQKIKKSNTARQTADTLAAIDEAASEITGLWWTGPSENAHVKTEVVAAIIARHLGMAAPPAAPAASKADGLTEGDLRRLDRLNGEYAAWLAARGFLKLSTEYAGTAEMVTDDIECLESDGRVAVK